MTHFRPYYYAVGKAVIGNFTLAITQQQIAPSLGECEIVSRDRVKGTVTIAAELLGVSIKIEYNDTSGTYSDHSEAAKPSQTDALQTRIKELEAEAASVTYLETKSAEQEAEIERLHGDLKRRDQQLVDKCKEESALRLELNELTDSMHRQELQHRQETETLRRQVVGAVLVGTGVIPGRFDMDKALVGIRELPFDAGSYHTLHYMDANNQLVVTVLKSNLGKDAP